MAPSDPLLVISLGNPGAEYAGTRHNVGAEVVEELARRCSDRLKADRKVSSSVAAVRIGDRRVQLAIPTTYMNDSGRSASQLIRRHPLENWADLIVVHDELDLELGVVKVKSGGGLAGHNGLKSVAEHLGTRDFLRVRIGVGKPSNSSQKGADWVLSRVSKNDRVELDISTVTAADAVASIATEGVDVAMQQYNAK